MADSLMNIARGWLDQPSKYSSNLKNVILEYMVNYGEESETLNILSEYSPEDSMPLERRLDILLGYCRIKDTKKATAYFNSIDTVHLGACEMKYLAIKPDYLELIGESAAAMNAYREYMDNKTERLERIMSQDLLFAQEHHDAEMASLKEIHHRDRIINIALVSLCVLLIVLGLFYSLWRKGKAQQELSEKENNRLRLEKENELLTNEILRNEKEKLNLDIENQKLTLDNQNLKIEKLEDEREPETTSE